jgi:dCMP deaminase
MNNTERPRPSWDEYGMLIARAAAQRSPDPYVIVGAAAFREDHSIISTGYNGAPPKIEIDWSNREARRPYVIHAECNCLKYTKPGEPYYLYVTLLPCTNCLVLCAAYGVKEIVYDDLYMRDQEAVKNAEKFNIVLRKFQPKPQEQHDFMI